MRSLLGIPYRDADCVRLTRLAMRALFRLRTRDPRRFPSAWFEVEPQDARPGDALTYRGETHIAAVVAPGYVLETRQGCVSHMVRIDRMRPLRPRFWRPVCT